MDRSLRQSQAFKYLGSVKTDEGSKPEILSRIAQATAALTRLTPVWNDRSISLSSKIYDWCAPLSQPFLYAFESWILTAELQRRIQAMEMRYYRKILRILYNDHVTNKEVHAKIRQAIGPREDLLTIVKRRRLQWYGHVFCLSGLAKTILKGTWKGEEEKADRGRDGKTTSGNGQAWSSPSPKGQRRTGKNRGNWLRNHLWCPNGFGLWPACVVLSFWLQSQFHDWCRHSLSYLFDYNVIFVIGAGIVCLIFLITTSFSWLVQAYFVLSFWLQRCLIFLIITSFSWLVQACRSGHSDYNVSIMIDGSGRGHSLSFHFDCIIFFWQQAFFAFVFELRPLAKAEMRISVCSKTKLGASV